EYLSIADLASVRRLGDRAHGRLKLCVRNDDLDLQLGQKVDDVFCAAIQLRMAALATEAFGFQHGHALQADPVKRLLHLVQLERLDDRFDLFHRCYPEKRRGDGGERLRSCTISSAASSSGARNMCDQRWGAPKMCSTARNSGTALSLIHSWPIC